MNLMNYRFNIKKMPWLFQVKTVVILSILNVMLFFIIHIVARENVKLNAKLYKSKADYINEFEKKLSLEADYGSLFNENIKGNIFDKGRALGLRPMKIDNINELR